MTSPDEPAVGYQGPDGSGAGLTGFGAAANRPGPGALWAQANAEHPGDAPARRARYRDLMVEHGHLIPGKQAPLPCGWNPAEEKT